MTALSLTNALAFLKFQQPARDGRAVDLMNFVAKVGLAAPEPDPAAAMAARACFVVAIAWRAALEPPAGDLQAESRTSSRIMSASRVRERGAS